jgi:hypothetical protein
MGPVVWLEQYGAWACTRYDEIAEVLSSPEAFRSGAGIGLSNIEKEGHWRTPSILLENDPPVHARVRSALTSILNPKSIRILRSQLEAEARLLVDRVMESESVDFVNDVATVFPLQVFPDVVGLTPHGRHNLLAYGRMVFDSMGPRNEIYAEVMKNASAVTAWIQEQTKRESLTPGGLGAKVYEAVDAGTLSESEAALTVRSFLSAGVDTTIHALGSAFLCFAQNPDQWQVLRANPANLRQAFDEVLRLYSPFQMYFRTTTQDLTLAETKIAEGSKVLLMVGAANRDHRRWSGPDTFDISRAQQAHLAFGRGIHTCVGQMIARLEADVLISEFLRRVESFDLLEQPVWQESNTLLGLQSLKVRVTKNSRL